MVTFSGGSVFEDKLKELSENIKKAATLKVGIMSNATYDDGTLVALVAACNEFGTTRKVTGADGKVITKEHSPPRPFMRGCIAEHSPEWPSQIAKVLEATNYDAVVTLEMIGELIEGQVKMSIRNFTDPPNAPSTIAKKGGVNNPLIFSGLMLRSVTHIVGDGTDGKESP
jgi:hypothetical protein